MNPPRLSVECFYARANRATCTPEDGKTVFTISCVNPIFAHSNHQFARAATTLATMVAYVGFTVSITTWRTKIRKSMNKLENEASARSVDSLLNYETVKYFNNEAHEVRRGENYRHASRVSSSL